MVRSPCNCIIWFFRRISEDSVATIGAGGVVMVAVVEAEVVLVGTAFASVLVVVVEEMVGNVRAGAVDRGVNRYATGGTLPNLNTMISSADRVTDCPGSSLVAFSRASVELWYLIYVPLEEL